MEAKSVQDGAREIWDLQRRQHGVVSRRQLLAAGVTSSAIERRLSSARLHRLYPGVYAVGRPEVTRFGRLQAAVLACGEGAVISHRSAAEVWSLGPYARIEVTVSPARNPRARGVLVRRRTLGKRDITVRHGVPVTSPARTLLDVSPYLTPKQLERAVNEADRLDLIDPERLRESLDEYKGIPGVAKLRTLLDRHTFTFSDSDLETAFRPIARAAGLPEPLTQQRVNGFRVDFYWPDLGLVVETDGLRYHRTPAQQAAAHRRDQAHHANGLLPLRFTDAQVAYDRPYVEETLRRTAARIRRGR